MDLIGSQGLVLKRMGSRLTLNWAFIGDSVNFVSGIKKNNQNPLIYKKKLKVRYLHAVSFKISQIKTKIGK